MRKGNGKSEVTNLDLDHELPASKSDEAGGEETSASSVSPPDGGAVSEVEKLKAERDARIESWRRRWRLPQRNRPHLPPVAGCAAKSGRSRDRRRGTTVRSAVSRGH